MEKFPELIVVGYTNIDINVTPSKKSIHPGGAAYFVAVASSLVLQPVGLVTRIGTDFDTTFLFQRVLTEGVHIIQDKPTAKSTQIYRSDTDLTDRDITLDWGVAPEVCPDDIPKQWLSHAKYIHIGTMPPKQQAPFLPYLRKHAPQAKISIDSDIFLLSDPQNVKTVTENFGNADIIFVNRREYEVLKDVVDIHPFVIFKKDKDGAVFLKKGTVVTETHAASINPVDVTGAGDILAGTFLAHLTHGDDVQTSLKEATIIATISVTKEGIEHLFP